MTPAELFDLIQAGKLRRLSNLNVSGNVGVADEGIFGLAYSLQSAVELAKGDDHHARGRLSSALESLIMTGLSCVKPRSFGARRLHELSSVKRPHGAED